MSKQFSTKTGRLAAGSSLLVGGVAGGLALAPHASAASTFHVTNTGDTGAGSLRQAIDDANNNAGADIIVFDAGSTGTITLTSGQLEITDDVTITGLGAAQSIISGNNASRIFYIYNSTATLTVSISGVTMTDGEVSSFGGAIANWGNDLTLTSVVITGNTSTNSKGGGIHSGFALSGLGANAPLTIIDSEISNNTSYDGGNGISADRIGNITITNSTLSGNTPTQTSYGGGGGGIRATNIGDLTITNSTVSNNTGGVYYYGGGGGGVYTQYAGNVTISESTFDSNTSYGDGGALYATHTTSFTMTNSTVSGNHAKDGAGLELGYNGDALIANSTIANNVGDPAYGDGSALYSNGSNGNMRIVFSTISGNETFNNTVRLNADAPFTVEITGTIISDNSTHEGTGASAVDLYSGALTTVSQSLIMGTSSSFTDGGGNILGVSAQLGPLADNGGATFTMEPAAGSPVIDAGPITLTAIFPGANFDQRGTPYTRAYNNDHPDIGALEVQPGPSSSSTTSSTTTSTTTVESVDTSTTLGTDPVAPAFTG